MNIQKGDKVVIQRIVRHPAESEIIARTVWGVTEHEIHCDDNIEYPKDQIRRINGILVNQE